MANIKSSAKRDEKSKELRAKNRAEKTELKTMIKKFDAAVAEGNKDAAADAYKVAVKTVDRAAGKGLLHKNNAGARTCAQKALQFAFMPSTLVALSQCDMNAGDIVSAILHLNTVRNMQPSLLYPKLYLMRMYHAGKDADSAYKMAQEILSTEVKVNSEEAMHIRREAEYLINKYQH